VPVYSSPNANIGVSAFTTGNNLPRGTGAGIGFRFNL
jgi:hypothetical protein